MVEYCSEKPKYSSVTFLSPMSVHAVRVEQIDVDAQSVSDKTDDGQLCYFDSCFGMRTIFLN